MYVSANCQDFGVPFTFIHNSDQKRLKNGWNRLHYGYNVTFRLCSGSEWWKNCRFWEYATVSCVKASRSCLFSENLDYTTACVWENQPLQDFWVIRRAFQKNWIIRRDFCSHTIEIPEMHLRIISWNAFDFRLKSVSLKVQKYTDIHRQRYTRNDTLIMLQRYDFICVFYAFVNHLLRF